MIKTLELSTANKSLAEYTEELSQETVILTLNGVAIAAVVSLKDVDAESLSLSLNPEFMSIIQQARNEFSSGEKLSLSEMKAALEEE